MLMVVELPIVAALMLTVDFRGMVYKATVLDVVVLKPFAPLPSVVYPSKLKAIVTDFEPSVSPVILPLRHGGLEYPDDATMPYSVF